MKRSLSRMKLQLRLARRDAAQLVHGLKYVQKNDWAWMHFKAAIGILLPLMCWINPPVATRTGLVGTPVMHAILIMLLVGGLISIVGMLARATRVRPLIVGYAIEMCGLIPLIAGPTLMAVIYAVSAYTGGASSLVGFAFCYALSAALFARYVDTHLHHLTSRKKGEGLRGKGGA